MFYYFAGNLMFFGSYMLGGLPYLSSSYEKRSAYDTFNSYLGWWLIVHLACAYICLGIVIIYYM